MPDRLYLSCWISAPKQLSVVDPNRLLRQFGKMLEVFPFSKLASRGPILRVLAIGPSEPPLLEREFPLGTEIEPMLTAAREFMHEDCACEVDTFWDLWQFEGEWRLRPAPVTLACLEPDFENEHGDDLRIEFGPDSRFLPAANIEGGLRMGQSNLKSLLHLIGEIERKLDLERRQVWSESGANFAEVLKQALGTYHSN